MLEFLDFVITSVNYFVYNICLWILVMGPIKCCSSVVVLDVHSICDQVLMLLCGSCNVESSDLPCHAGPEGMEEISGVLIAGCGGIR